MPEIINGSAAAFQNRESISFTPNIGGEYGGRFEGPKTAVMVKLNELINSGYHVQYECDASPIATVTFNSVTNSNNPGGVPVSPNLDYTDTFQLSRNTVQKEILASNFSDLNYLALTHINQLKQWMKKKPPNPPGWLFTDIGNATSLTVANYIASLWRAGVKSIEVKQPVLRVTRVTNPLYDAPFSTTLVDKVLTTSRMIYDSGVPSNFAVPLIALANRLTTTVTRTDGLILNYGWLKDSFTSETVGTTRNQYTVEYKFGAWDQVLHGLVVA